MPAVPKQANQPLRAEALPGVRASVRATPDDFGAQVGQTGQKVFGDIVQEEQRKADEIAVMSANRQLTEHQTNLLYDPKEGAFTKRGRDAFDIPEKYGADLDTKISELESGLTERQRQAFRRSADNTRNQFNLQIQRHVFQERERYDEEESSKAVTTARDDAVNNFLDPQLVSSGIAKQTATLADYARRNGKSAVWLKERMQDAESATHLGVIERALATGNDKYASTYYKEVSGLLRGKDGIQAAKLVEAGSLQGESQRQADQIIDKIAKSGRDTYGHANELVKEIQDPKVRDLVQQRVDAEFTRRERIQRQTESDTADYVARLIDSGRSWDSIPVTVKDNLSAGARSSMEAYWRAKSKGDDVKTDWGTYYKLMNMAAEQNRNPFLKVDLMEYRSRLGDTEFKQLVGLQASMQRKDDRAEDEITGFRTVHEQIDSALRSINVDPRPKEGTRDAKEVDRLRTLVDEQIIDFRRLNGGRKPNTEEVRSIIDNLLIKGEVPGSGWFWNDKKRPFQLDLSKGEQIRYTYDMIPPAEIQKIKGALSRSGANPDDKDRIVQEYTIKMNRVVQRGQQTSR